MGSKPSSQQQSTTTYSPPAAVLQEYQNVTNEANQVAATPYSPYTGPLVAPVNQQQSAGISGINAANGIQTPYNNASAAYAVGSTTALNPESYFGSSGVNAYYSPYQKDVVNATEAQFNNQNAQQSSALLGQGIAAGNAFGGDREGIAQSVLAGQQQTAEAPVIAGIENTGYTNAQNEFNSQQQTQLAAEQQNNANKLAASQALGGLGSTAQQEAINEATAQTNAGAIEQQTQQQQDTAAYNQYLQQFAYPFQTTGWLANIAEGIGSQSGGTSSGVQTTESNNTSGLIGAGLGLLSFLARGGAARPQRASGGGIGGAVGSMDPWSLDMVEGEVAPGAGGIVPAINLPIGNTMPKGQTPGAPQQQSSSNGGLPSIQSGLQGLSNSSLGDSVSDFMQDAFGFKKGGSVGIAGGMYRDKHGVHGGIFRPHFEMGGQMPSTKGIGLPQNQVTVNGPHGSYSAPISEAEFGWQSGGGGSPHPAAASGISPSDPWAPQRNITSGVIALKRGGGIRPHYDGGGDVFGALEPIDGDFGGLSSSGLDPTVQPVVGSPSAGLAAAMSPQQSNGIGTVQPNTTMGFGALAPSAATAAGAVDYASPSGPFGAIAGNTPTPPPRPADLEAPAPVGVAGNGQPTDIAPALSPHGQVVDYIRKAAIERGIDPNTAVAVASSEGLVGYDPTRPDHGGDGGSSFGPFQLHYGAFNPKMPNAGLGDAFTAKTGMDARDPSTWRQQVDFALDHAAKNGWGDWMGAANTGIPRWAGIGGGAPSDALAFGDQPRGGVAPAVAAINRAAPAPGVTSDGDSGQPGVGGAPQGGTDFLSRLFGSGSNAGGKERSGLIGLNLSDQERLGLLAAGLGIMSGKSLNPWQNIGAGGLQGIEAMRGAAGTSADIGLKQAQTAKALTETALQQRQLDLMMKALEQNQQLFSKHADNVSEAASNPNQPAPSATEAIGVKAPSPPIAAPNVVGQVQPAPSQGGKTAADVDPLFDPQRLIAASQMWAPIDAARSNAYRGQAEAILKGDERVRFNDGSYGYFPGIVSSGAQKAAATASAEAAAKVPYETAEIQPTPGGPTYTVPKSQVLNGVGAGSPPGIAANEAAAANPTIAKQPAFYAERQSQIAKNEDEMIQQMQVRQLSRQRLQTLKGIMQGYQPGAFASEKAGIVSALRGVGIDVPDTATANPAAFQEFMKNATANVFNDVKGMGGRVLVSEIEGLTKANANPELQPAAAAAIIGQGLGVLDYEDQHTKDYFDWKHQNPTAYDTSTFEIPWMQKHQVGDFVDKATKGISYKGQVVPAKPEERTVGQTYLTPKGPMTWRGNGWQPAGASP